MTTLRRGVILNWVVVGGLAAAVTLPLARPLVVAWRCGARYDGADRVGAEVLSRLDEGMLALRILDGPAAGLACTADTQAAIHASARPGDVLEVVHLDARPGTCELASTVDASATLLWTMTGTLALVLLGLGGLGLFLHRSFTRPVRPDRRMEVDPSAVPCPACGKTMDEGCLAVLSGLHWRGAGQPLGLPNALAGLPGTVGWRGRPRLHAFRCAPCEIVTFQYGEPPRRATPGLPRFVRRMPMP